MSSRLRRRAGVRGLAHDYRSDLAAFTAIAFDLPADPALMRWVEAALRARELQWAERRVVAEQFAPGPRTPISRQMKSWSAVDTQVAAEVG